MQKQIYVEPSHQKIIDGIISFFREKNHCIDQIGYCLIVSLESTIDEYGQLGEKEGVHLFTRFYLCSNSDNELTDGLGLIADHCEENIKAMVEGYLKGLGSNIERSRTEAMLALLAKF